MSQIIRCECGHNLEIIGTTYGNDPVILTKKCKFCISSAYSSGKVDTITNLKVKDKLK